MSDPDRANELARQLVRVLPDADGNPGIDIAGTWFDWGSDAQAAADGVITKLAAALRAYAEEAIQKQRASILAFGYNAALNDMVTALGL